MSRGQGCYYKHPTLHRIAPHNKELSDPKCQQCENPALDVQTYWYKVVECLKRIPVYIVI